MSATEAPRQPATSIMSFVFEATQRCNHDCPHCYNAWKNPVNYPRGELGTKETLALLGKMLDGTAARLVSLSGGEPLLRRDIHEIVDFLRARGAAINLITNGSLVDDAVIEKLKGKISIFEIPLLSVEREVHDRMSGANGAFDAATLAMASLKAVGERVVGVFVATKLNLPQWRRTAELAVALGIDGLMFNRFNPGGRGRENVGLLQASPREISEALDTAQAVSEQYGLPISCSIALPPCLVDASKHSRLSFGFCSAGTYNSYYTLDPLGNVRPCNHSPTILGNLRETPYLDVVLNGRLKAFCDARPEFCAGCRHERTCQGGCKAAAEACSGSPSAEDPFLHAFRDQARKQ